MNIAQLTVIKADTEEQFSDVQHLHRTIWDLDDIEVIPQHILVAAQRSGGLVLCAYEAGRPVGFSFGFCALMDDGTVALYSHNLGVIEKYRNSGVGYHLKLRQREHMLQKQIPLSYWTFDPLESRNAYFNVKKLGCICRRYVIDYYGPMRDSLNAQLPSDRLIAEWWVNTPRVMALLGVTSQSTESRLLTEPESDKIVNPSEECRNGLRRPTRNQHQFVSSSEDAYIEEAYVEIPADYQHMREHDLGLALEWRLAVRSGFQACFSRLMVVTGFVFTGDRSFYILRREPEPR